MFGNVFVHIALELWGSMFCIVVMVLIWLGKEDGSKADRKLVQFEGLVAAMLFFDTVYRILESMSEAVGRLSVQISLGVNLIMVNMTLV